VIGFIGLVVPHLARLIFRPDHHLTFPVSALLGGTLLLMADAVARSVAAPLDLPIGTITALGGAPFFLVLLLRTRGRGLL
jgi:iron complex transport system permease protein